MVSDIPIQLKFYCQQPPHSACYNYTMNKRYAQLVSYNILYLNPSSHHYQPLYKKYIAV